jgi:hypothetical protein
VAVDDDGEVAGGDLLADRGRPCRLAPAARIATPQATASRRRVRVFTWSRRGGRTAGQPYAQSISRSK